MELKDIEKFFKDFENFQNLYKIGLFFVVVILLYITVIGTLIVSIVNDKTYTGEKRIYNVKKTMQDIIDINNIVMYVLFGVFPLFLGFVIYKNKNTLNAMVDNKFTLLVLVLLFVSIVVMLVMNSFCKYIQDIKETDLYNHGLGMLWGGISAIVVIVTIFIWYRKNISRTIATTRIQATPTTSRPIDTTRIQAPPTTSRPIDTTRIQAPPTTSRPASRTIAAAAA